MYKEFEILKGWTLMGGQFFASICENKGPENTKQDK